MVLNHKIIACIPFGRKRYVEILMRYITHYVKQGIIDECRLLINTDNPDDLVYANWLAQTNAWIYLDRLQDQTKRDAVRVKDFYYQWKDPNAVYLKIDDDITYIDPTRLEKFLEFRITHPEYFIVFPTIINSAATSFYYQGLGIIPPTSPMIGQERWNNNPLDDHMYRGGVHCLDKVANGSGEFAEALHNLFLSDRDKFIVPDWHLHNYENININLIALLGSDLIKITEYAENDENDLTYTKPKQFGKFCYMVGNFPVAHYAFWPQRPYLDSTDILDKYRKLADEVGV